MSSKYDNSCSTSAKDSYGHKLPNSEEAILTEAALAKQTRPVQTIDVRVELLSSAI
jgi:hypothetical protein